MANEQLRELYESPNQDYAIFTLDKDGYITTWNDGATRMKRYTPEEAIGQHYSMLYPEDANLRDEPMQHLRDAVKNGYFRGEGIRLRKGKIPFIADVQITAIYRKGRVIGFSKVVADVTEQGRIRSEREEAIRGLKIERELRERFVVTLTHDLRNPLAAAKAAVDLIARTSKDQSHLQLATLASLSLSRVDAMISNLLDVNRITSGEALPLSLEVFDLSLLLSEVVSELTTVCGDRFRLETTEPQIGNWDARALRRAIDNLVANAAKYGDQFTPIAIKCTGAGDRVRISVHNSGEPISQEDQKYIFQQFRRTGSEKSRKTKGWGIGLSLVRGVAESHGGTVRVESSAERGTTFIVELPRDAAAKTRKAA